MSPSSSPSASPDPKPVVAIAGHGYLGRSIIESIISRSKFSVLILARSLPRSDSFLFSPPFNLNLDSNANDSSQALKLEIIDFTSLPNLIQTLQTYKVHTILSNLPSTKDSQIEMNLLEAAIRTENVRRFSPPGYNISRKADRIMGAGYRAKERMEREVGGRFASYNNSIGVQVGSDIMDGNYKKEKKEWTIFRNGVFMNLLASGSKLPSAESELYRDLRIFSDFANLKAYIPGTTARTTSTTGMENRVDEVEVENQWITMTRIKDIGEMVARSLEIPFGSWSQEYAIIGERTTLNRVVKQAEEVLLGSNNSNVNKKIERIYESEEGIKELERKVDEGGGNSIDGVKVAIRRGWADVETMMMKSDDNINTGGDGKVLNQVLKDLGLLDDAFEPMRIKGFLEKCWKKD